MSDVAIRVEGLSKLYRIGRNREKYKTFRDAIADMARRPFRRRAKDSENLETSFWALKDLSFEVKPGEVVGVIGPNGAGKSTLLKILSRITDPTDGFAEIHGRVGSLLEVGTGFHHELSGRENIFLNGAILGMRRSEIEAKFDEIVAFAEVSRFIDTPVKHYSSGMYLRLAFAVAAHLEPEILLVDEVLAVGDLAFQKKCLQKMEDVASHGRTVLFVSHNLGAIRELCQTTVVLNQGALDFRGPVAPGLMRYSHNLTAADDGAQSGTTGWRALSLNGEVNGAATTVPGDDSFYTEASLELAEEFSGGRLFCIVHNSVGDIVVHKRVESRDICDELLVAGRYKVRVDFPAIWLAPGVYTMYFKFIGNTASGLEEKLQSERVMLDVSGESYGIGRASLSPRVRWRLTREEVSSLEPIKKTA